jgi:hypothetical protein
MKNRFQPLCDAIHKDAVAQFLFTTLPTDKLGSCFVLYEKKPFDTHCRYYVYSLDPGELADKPNVDLELDRGRVWLDLSLRDSQLVIDPIVTTLPDYRIPVSVNLKKPLMSWTSSDIPDALWS